MENEGKKGEDWRKVYREMGRKRRRGLRKIRRILRTKKRKY
jgi:hypothetical protein